MAEQKLEKLPGAEIVLPGIEDLKAGRETVNALAVRAAAKRLASTASSATSMPTSPLLTGSTGR